MNPPKCNVEDCINFVIVTPRQVTATEAERLPPESKDAPADDAFIRLLPRLEPDSQTLWAEALTQLELEKAIPVVDDSTPDKPYSRFNDLVYRRYSGKPSEHIWQIRFIRSFQLRNFYSL